MAMIDKNSCMNMDSEAPPIGDEQEESKGFTICIKVAGDGSISVGTEPCETEEEEAEEGAGQYKPVANAREALSAAMDLIKSGGTSNMDSEDNFNAGFGKPAKSLQMANREEE